MKILILNWRSIKDPWAGGSEIATFEHAKRWVKNRGAEVHWISPKYDFDISDELVEGVHFEYISFPLGRNIFKLLVAFPFFYICVIFSYFARYRGKVDVVIDQIHGIPFLTPLYVKEKIVVFVHEVGGSIWDKMYPVPINIVGRFLETALYRFYKNRLVVTVSESTKKDLVAAGVAENSIRVIKNGVSIPVLNDLPEKFEEFTLIFLNRLVKMKGIERALKVFSHIKSKYDSAKLLVVGRADIGYLSEIKTYCENEGISDSTEFIGYISEERKIELLSKSHILLNTSYKEGWGLVNLEANARGVPVVAFAVNGNTESVMDGVSGYLVPDNEIELMADRALKAKDDVELRKRCLEFSRKFCWDKLSEDFYSLL